MYFNYPAKIEELNLKSLKSLQEILKIKLHIASLTIV